MPREADGLTIRYQGRLCKPQFEFSSSVGLEPAFGVVFMELDDLGDFTVQEIVPDETTGEFKTQERQSGLQSAGVLEFIEVTRDDDGLINLHATEWKNILVTEKAIEVSYALDDSKNEVAKIELTDERYMWSSRGEVCMWVNVPKSVDPDASPGKTATGGGAAAQQQQRDQLAATARRVAATAAELSSLKNEVEFAKLKIERDKITAKTKSAQTAAETQKFDVLGDPLSLPQIENKIKGLEAALKLDEAFLEGYQKEHSAAAGASKTQEAAPKPIFADVGAELIPSSTDEGKPWTVKNLLTKKILPALWGAPKLKRIPEDVAAAHVGSKTWDPPVLPKTALHEVLEEFQVVLARNADATVSIWKKNEGELQEEGEFGAQIRFNPAEDALDQRVAAARRLLNFARVPEVVHVVGAPRISSKHERLVPVGVKDGKIVPLAEALENIGLTMTQGQAFALLPHSSRAALLGVFEDGLKEFERWAFKWFRLPGEDEDLAERLPILEARASFGKAGELLPPRVWSRGHAIISTLDALKTLQRIKQVVAAGSSRAPAYVFAAIEALKAADTKQMTAVVNVPFSEQQSGYTLDLARGIVKFDRVQGPVRPEGGPLSTASIDARGLQVELEYAYLRKPGYQLGSGVSVSDRFSSVWVRDKTGTAVQRAALPLGVAPYVVHRPDLQQVEFVDGRDNKKLLDAIAKGVAQHQFDVDLPHVGAVVEMCRPVQVQLNGAILSCTWAVNDEVPSTTAHVGSFAPLTPAPRLSTRAFGDIARFDRLAKDSTFAPKGLSQ